MSIDGSSRWHRWRAANPAVAGPPTTLSDADWAVVIGLGEEHAATDGGAALVAEPAAPWGIVQRYRQPSAGAEPPTYPVAAIVVFPVPNQPVCSRRTGLHNVAAGQVDVTTPRAQPVPPALAEAIRHLAGGTLLLGSVARCLVGSGWVWLPASPMWGRGW